MDSKLPTPAVLGQIPGNPNSRKPAFSAAELDGFHPLALATPTGCLTHLLAALDRRFHVVATPLELPQDAFGRHLALEVLDGSLDAFVADGDLEGLTLD